MAEDIEKARARQLRYAHSPKGQIARARYDQSPKREAARLRHELTRGYHRKRLKALEAQRESIIRQLEELDARYPGLH